MLQSFEQAKEYLYRAIPGTKNNPFPGKPGLARMQCLLKLLGDPEDKFVSVHIAGTSGKSSTAYLTAAILKRAGYKAGLHISPHLQTMRERMQINGQLVSQKEFIRLINQIKPAADKMSRNKHGRPSYFEMLLAAAFLHFARQKVDLAVIEAGLGGRFDGTNVLHPAVVVLTSVGLDHTDILGRTRTAILRDKMQIIKPGARFIISGIKQEHLLKILRAHCLKQKVPLLVCNQDFFVCNPSYKQNYSRFDFKCAGAGYGSGLSDNNLKDIKIALPGIFQTENAGLAIAVCLCLGRNGSKKFKVSGSNIKNALAGASFPGRMETVNSNPLIILDGAHNEDKVKALIKSIKKLYPELETIVVIGIKKDKKADKLLSLLGRISRQFVITEFGRATDLGFKLHYPAKKLFSEAKRVLPEANLALEPDSKKALQKARRAAGRKKLILITGSLYLIGEMRKYFKAEPNLSERKA